jgi:hypothetical protein
VDTAPFAGRLSHCLSKEVGQVRFVDEAALSRDLAKRVVAHQQKLLSARNAPAHDVLMGRAVKAVFEDPAESIGGILEHPDQIRHPDCRVQMCGDVCLHAACLP